MKLSADDKAIAIAEEISRKRYGREFSELPPHLQSVVFDDAWQTVVIQSQVESEEARYAYGQTV
jgi:hypothetical protein